ncbi:metN1, partial [Symbiodinium necroappetens]
EEEEEEEALPPWAQQLSSSEKWRFQLARAFVHDPHVLLVHRPADELDPQMQEKVLSCFRDFVDRRGLEINEEIGSHLPPDRRRPRT